MYRRSASLHLQQQGRVSPDKTETRLSAVLLTVVLLTLASLEGMIGATWLVSAQAPPEPESIQRALIVTTPGPPASIALDKQYNTIFVKGGGSPDSSVITATVTDSEGNRVADGTVATFTLTTSSGSWGSSTTVRDTIETDITADGQITRTLHGWNIRGTAKIKAQSDSVVATTTVNIGMGPFAMTLQAESTTITVGTSTTLTATIKSSEGNPAPAGTVVTFTTSAGTVDPQTTTIDDNGQAGATFTAPTYPGRAVIRATAHGGSFPTDTETITFTADVLDHFTFDPIPPQQVGVPFSVTLHARDRYGNHTSFSGNVNVDCTPSCNVSPTSVNLTALDAGVITFTVVAGGNAPSTRCLIAIGDSATGIECFDLLPGPCTYDFDGSGTVDSADVQTAAGHWRQTGELPYDLDGDGTVTIRDIMQVVVHLGESCQQTGATNGGLSG